MRADFKVWQVLLRTSKHVWILGVLFFAFFPLYMMLNISLKDNAQFYSNPLGIQAPFHWENWTIGEPGDHPGAWASIHECLVNSLWVSITATILGVSAALCGAYFFARVKMPGSGLLWALLVFLIMMPTVGNLVPLFVLLKNLHLLNTLTALILVGSAGMQAFSIFILRGFVEQIPNDLFEAAEIDGASHFQQFWNIVVPLSAPIAGTVAMNGFLQSWNDFILPLVVIRDPQLYTVSVGLSRLDGEYLKYWGPMMAGFSISSVPVIILFVFTMRLFIQGISDGAVKN